MKWGNIEKKWPEPHPMAPQHPFAWGKWEYYVWQEVYDPSEANPDGIEQGYRLPHVTDHNTNRYWSPEKREREYGPVILEDFNYDG